MAEAAARRGHPPGPGKAPPPRPGRWWLTPAGVALCVGLELLVARSSLDHALLSTALVGLAVVAVGLALAGSLGLRRESRALRAIIAAPLALCVVTTVVLMLEAAYRRGQVRP